MCLLDELYITENDIFEVDTVNELIDKLELANGSERVVVYNRDNDGVFGVYHFELNGGAGIGHSLSIGRSLVNKSSTVYDLITSLQGVINEDVYTRNGGRFRIFPHSKVFIGNDNSQQRVVGVSEYEGIPIIVTKN